MEKEILLNAAYVFIFTVLNLIPSILFYFFGWHFNIRIFGVTKRVLLNRVQSVFYKFKVANDDFNNFPSVICLWYERFAVFYLLISELTEVLFFAFNSNPVYICRVSAVLCALLIIVWISFMQAIDRMIKKRVRELSKKEIEESKILKETVDYVESGEWFLKGLFIDKKLAEPDFDYEFDLQPINDDDFVETEETCTYEDGKVIFNEQLKNLSDK